MAPPRAPLRSVTSTFKSRIVSLDPTTSCPAKRPLGTARMRTGPSISVGSPYCVGSTRLNTDSFQT